MSQARKRLLEIGSCDPDHIMLELAKPIMIIAALESWMSDTPEDERQSLALIRTDLANERTLLAYGRTALMFTATGVTLIKFFPDSLTFNLAGWASAAIGLAIGAVGITRFTRMRRKLRL